MEIKVLRTTKGEGFTIGHMFVRDLDLFTLEDEVREVAGYPVESWKIAGQSAIPVGRYQVIITFSNRFQKELPLLKDVPGFTGVRIHSGNCAADTEGCILVGKTINQAGDRIMDSRSAMHDLMEVLEEAYERHEEVWLDID